MLSMFLYEFLKFCMISSDVLRVVIAFIWFSFDSVWILYLFNLKSIRFIIIVCFSCFYIIQPRFCMISYVCIELHQTLYECIPIPLVCWVSMWLSYDLVWLSVFLYKILQSYDLVWFPMLCWFYMISQRLCRTSYVFYMDSVNSTRVHTIPYGILLLLYDLAMTLYDFLCLLYAFLEFYMIYRDSLLLWYVYMI